MQGAMQGAEARRVEAAHAAELSEVRPLTSLRFVAAFYVFVFHIHIRWPVASGAIDNLLSAGAIGMSLFFMLSGFILAHRHQSGELDVRDYLTNRFARIYPVYALTAILTLPWILGGTVGERSLVENVLTAALLVFADTFLIQAWFPQMFAYWNNGGSWSISVEAFFYVMFPAIFPVLFRRTAQQVVAVALAAYLVSVAIGAVAIVFKPRPDYLLPIFYAMPIFRFPEFVLGICVFLAWRRTRLREVNPDLLYAAIFVVLLPYLMLLGKRVPLYIGHNWIVVPAIAALLVAGAQRGGYVNRLLGHALPVWLGRISYCFYSFQLIVLLVLFTYRDAIVQAVPAMADNGILLAASLAVLVLLSAAGFHLVEEPMRKAIRRRSRAPRRPSTIGEPAPPLRAP